MHGWIIRLRKNMMRNTFDDKCFKEDTNMIENT